MCKLIKQPFEKIKNYIQNNIILYNYKSIIITSISLFLVIFFSYNIRSLYKFKLIKNKQNFLVTIHNVQQKDIPVIINANGIVKPINNVLIKPQIDGTILKTYFNEGAIVHQGQLLFEIDSSLLQTGYDQANANLHRTIADLENAQLQLNKYNKLYQKKFITTQEHEQFITNFKIAAANHEAAVANFNANKIQLEYTKIYSPINGIAGQILIKPGNIVKSINNTGLVNINQLDPIEVSFLIPDEHLPELTRNIAQLDKFKVELIDYQKIGKIVFLDNHIDDLSGTILLKAEFANTDHLLWPGKFVNIALHISTLSQALVIPNRAIQVGQHGNYVYALEPLKSLKNKNLGKIKKIEVKIGNIFNNETVITDGLDATQKVVIEGHGHLADHMIVETYANK